MYYIDPHIHMISRVTDDYHRMAQCGCVAISEPAFWAGFDRGSVEGFRDYFRHLTEVEPKRAAQFHIKHYSWLCINAKEAENVSLSREVIALIPEYLDKPNVLGIGEIGLNKNTKNESTVFQEHVDLAMKTNELILIHTPHLEDKYMGTRMIVDMLKNDKRVMPERVLIDHVEEHTVRLALDNGFWCAMTLYPTTKCTPERAADILEMRRVNEHQLVGLDGQIDMLLEDSRLVAGVLVQADLADAKHIRPVQILRDQGDDLA